MHFRLLVVCLTGVGLLLNVGKVSAQLIINEVMQSNVDCVMDDLNEFPDSWVELYNTSSKSINLRDYSIGLKNNASKAYSLPSATIEAYGHVLVYCDKESSGKHTDFRLESTEIGAVYLFKNGAVTDKFENIPIQPTPNIAYGRKTDGSNVLGWLLTPTPTQKNCGKLADSVLGTPVFSDRGGLISGTKAITLKLSLPANTPSGTEIRYTTDGSEPIESSNLYTTSLRIDTSCVIRARLFKAGCISARSHTESYLRLDHETSLPIVSVVTDPKFLYDESIGIYVVGKDSKNANYDHDWRRPMNFEFFEASNSVSVLNQLCEARIHGCTSRVRSLKSLAFYAHKRFGQKRFKYEMFPKDRPGETKYQSFILRNAGSDYYGLYMRDAIIQRSTAWNVDLDYEAYRAAVVFVNGKYVGIQNLRERSNDNNIETNYGLEETDVIKNNYEVVNGDSENWTAFQAFYNESGHTWDEFEKWMDCQEYINLMVMSLFYNNVDFPGCNIICWRPKNANDGYPTRWRWIAKDCEMAMGFSGMEYTWDVMAWFNDPNYSTRYAWANTSKGTRLLRTLLTDKTFFDRFVNCAMAYMGDFLNYECVWKEVWEPMYEAIKDEYPYHRALYEKDYPSWISYESDMEYTKTWMQERGEYFAASIGSYYGLGKPRDLVIECDSSISFSFNGVSVKRPYWKSFYYPNRKIVLKSSEPSEWSVQFCSTRDTVIKTFSGDSCEFSLAQKYNYTHVTVTPINRHDGVGQVLSPAVSSKFIRDGQVFIRRGDEVYDMFGRRVK